MFGFTIEQVVVGVVAAVILLMALIVVARIVTAGRTGDRGS